MRNDIIEMKRNANKKLPTKMVIRVARNFKIILASLLVLVFILNSHVILYFRVKIEFTTENLKKEMFRFQNQSMVIKFKRAIREMSFREILDMSICVPSNEFYKNFMQSVWIYIDMSIIFLIPFVTMTFSFVFVFFKVKIANENYTEFLRDNDRALNRNIYERKINKNKCIVFKLFIINAYFLLTVMPYFVFVIFLERGNFGFLKNFVMCLFFSNNALNILFYGITCGRFREELRKMNMFR